MAWFEDADGRKWIVRPDGDIVERWKDEAKINVFALLDDKCALMSDLMRDTFAQMELLWIACSEQAQEEGIASRREFAKLLSGDVLLAAVNALWEGIGDFFPHRETRELFSVLLVKGKKTAEIVSSTQLMAAKRVDPEKLASILRGTSTNSQELSESIPES